MAIDESRPFIPVRIAVLTVSDTRTADDDRSGDTLAARIIAAGHVLAARAIVRDETDAIIEAMADSSRKSMPGLSPGREIKK